MTDRELMQQALEMLDEDNRLLIQAYRAIHNKQPEPSKLWLWKNFVDGKPEYWAFDNPYPTNLDNGDPQTLGQPCGYAILKPSRDGSNGRTEEQVLREITSVKLKAQPEPEPVAWMIVVGFSGPPGRAAISLANSSAARM